LFPSSTQFTRESPHAPQTYEERGSGGEKIEANQRQGRRKRKSKKENINGR
jgi:hypothetical protein